MTSANHYFVLTMAWVGFATCGSLAFGVGYYAAWLLDVWQHLFDGSAQRFVHGWVVYQMNASAKK
jgi:hypothetical protein